MKWKYRVVADSHRRDCLSTWRPTPHSANKIWLATENRLVSCIVAVTKIMKI